jgi:flagellar basal body P-ring protein FlgI
LCGCVWEHENKQRLDVGVAAIPHALANSAAYRDTIGAITYYEGLGPMRVRGYGLVVGLGKNGSADCPRPVYERLVQTLYKHHCFSSSVVGVKEITPEQLIADLDTAVVIVQGEIPPAAVDGTPFDVHVMALPGTQTKSLRGGRLYTTELEVFRPLPSGVSITGQVMATASGPIFLNPFADGDSATKANPLEGTIGGGGVATKARRIRLVLTEPSYRSAQKIQDRINARFPGPSKTADAISPSFVQLHMPPEFHDDTGHFLSLVRSLYLTRDPQFETGRARALAEELAHSAAPHAQIAWCLEGLGRAAVPALAELYTHPKDDVSFHAAVAGLRLQEHIACDAMTMHAENPRSAFRFQAIRALAEAKGMAPAGIALRKLLNDDDPRVQIAAYEALVQRGDATIGSRRVAKDNFTLDYVPSSRSNFIYVKRAGERRIALFGDGLRCSPPVLYRAPDGSVTINANVGEEELIVLRAFTATRAMSPPIPAPFELRGLIALLGGDAAVDARGEAVGLGLDYGAVVRALYHLCQSQAVNARFILEQPNAAELFGPAKPEGRLESEL